MESGFDDCVEALNDSAQQKELEESFYRWSGKCPMPKIPKSKLATLSTKQARCIEFELELNCSYKTSSAAKWVRWAIAKKSTIAGAGYGLFSGKRFEKGDTVGVYMAQKMSPPRSVGTNCRRISLSYAAAGIGDAQGGVDSDAPVHLGMHLMNDPCWNKSGSAKCSCNVKMHSDGRIIALRRIYEGEELFLCYNFNE
jgi:hypothetical protein